MILHTWFSMVPIFLYINPSLFSGSFNPFSEYGINPSRLFLKYVINLSAFSISSSFSRLFLYISSYSKSLSSSCVSSSSCIAVMLLEYGIFSFIALLRWNGSNWNTVSASQMFFTHSAPSAFIILTSVSSRL